MTFRILALPREPFAHLAALSDPALAGRDIRRITVDECPGTPCRVSLEDAAVGETVYLLPWAHLMAASPYRASGPIFVPSLIPVPGPQTTTWPLRSTFSSSSRRRAASILKRLGK